MRDLARQKNTIEKQVVERMKKLGVYKVEYRNTINVYVDMLHQYEVLTERFEEDGYKVMEEYTNKAGATNMRKTPVFGALEKLRMDLVAYSNVLCLNPKSIESIKIEKSNGSNLADVLSRFEKDD